MARAGGAVKVYVAGPMRRLPEFNFPAFHYAAKALRERGHEVFNPAEADENNGFDPSGMTGQEDLSHLGFDLRSALGADLAFICHKADAVVVLNGWERSLGANAEVATARALGLRVATLEEFCA
jgi:hypothetical protein